ncbi:MAG: helix-turn-helix domain-containing protein [Candidatus Thorarchaeota archaeon]|nr:helix-turn-helix domain-containing protein [Candidatus Thorarchaeota archaeon]
MTSDEVFEAISHPMRIAILKELAKKPIRFADLKRKLRIKSGGLLDFHLKKMEAVIITDKDGLYTLNNRGFAALRAVHIVTNYGWQRRSWWLNVLMMFMLNIYFFFTAFEFYIFVAIPTFGWLLFYSYWTFVKRRVSLRSNGADQENVEVS